MKTEIRNLLGEINNDKMYFNLVYYYFLSDMIFELSKVDHRFNKLYSKKKLKIFQEDLILTFNEYDEKENFGLAYNSFFSYDISKTKRDMVMMFNELKINGIL